MNIYLDIETIGTSDPDLIADLTQGIAPPKNYTKPETIAKWEAEEKPALVKEVVNKTAFDGGAGRIVCLGWAINDGEASCRADTDEREMLSAFFGVIRSAALLHYRGGDTKRPIAFVGHNIAGFDLRFLWQRAVVHGIRPPPSIPFNVKPWDQSIADTMLMWNPERDRKVKLGRLCQYLGVESPKGDLDGSRVWEYVKAGRLAEVVEYCKGDVNAVRQCYQRMTFATTLELA